MVSLQVPGVVVTLGGICLTSVQSSILTAFHDKSLSKEGLGPVNNPKSSGNTITRQSIRSHPAILRILQPNRADRPDHLTTLTILITPINLTTTANTQSTLITPTWHNNLQNICQHNTTCDLKTLQKNCLERRCTKFAKSLPGSNSCSKLSRTIIRKICKRG